MEYVQSFIGPACQPTKRLIILCRQNVEDRKIDDKEDPGAIGEGECVLHRHRHTVEEVEEVQGKKSEDQEGDLVRREGVLRSCERRYWLRLPQEKRPDIVPSSHI